MDGKYYEADSGEYVADAVAEGFQIKDESSCNWVLQKYMDAEAQIAAVTGSPEVLQAKAILANAEAIEKKLRNRLRWLDMRFTAELGEYARKMLTGKREKTYKTILGAISLRVKKGGLKVADKDLALEWAKKQLPENIKDLAIKTEETFMISALTDGIVEEIKGAFERTEPVEEFQDYDERTRAAFVIEPDTETVAIKTGVSSK
jgi:hypothetical protein